MKKIRVNLLLRNREVRKLLIEPKQDHFEHQGGLYMLSGEKIRLDQQEVPEVYYFEGNPTPISNKASDNSSNYLNQLIRINFIEQVDNVPNYRGSFFGEILKTLANPQALIILMLGGAVLYSLLSTPGGLALW